MHNSNISIYFVDFSFILLLCAFHPQKNIARTAVYTSCTIASLSIRWGVIHVMADVAETITAEEPSNAKPSGAGAHSRANKNPYFVCKYCFPSDGVEAKDLAKLSSERQPLGWTVQADYMTQC